jgi:LmbE family N-acetylglucosaminyl deacetylase
MNLPRLLIGFAVLTGACAQPYATSIQPAVSADEIWPNQGSTALWQSLKKLQTRASLIMITAHPDDEDGGMLTYESRGRGARAALLTLNRGEGGANVMSADYFDALGLVRTMELLSAGRYYGVDQYWTRVVDYGFSKTKAESISRWTHDRVLADVVRVIRIVRPLVVTSVFVGGPSDGHGNHQTAGAMAQEAFNAAGDPNMFPEQIRDGLRPWAPLKDYARVPGGRRGGDTVSANVTIPQGDYDPVLGRSYVQIAREGLGFQKSQNGGPSIPWPGQLTSAYHRYASNVSAAEKEGTFFDGIDTSLIGIATLAQGGDDTFLRQGLEAIHKSIREAVAKFSSTHPEQVAPSLAAGLTRTLQLLEAVERSKLPAQAKYDLRHELEIKRVQFNQALSEALGLSLSAVVAPVAERDLGDLETMRIAIPGQTFGVRVHTVSQAAVKLDRLIVEPYRQKQAWRITSEDNPPSGDLAANQPVEARLLVTVPDDAAFTRPYFIRPDIEQSYYDIDDESFLSDSLPPYPLAAWAEFTYEGAPIRVGQCVQTMNRVTGLGSVYEPLAVGPAIGVAMSARAGIVPLGAGSFPVSVVVHSNVKGEAAGSVHLEVPSGWSASPVTAQFATKSDGEDQSITFTVKPASLVERAYQINAVADFGGRQYREGYNVTGYPGLRPYFLYRASTYRTTGVDVKIASDLKVGYIMGTGDEVPAALEHLGVPVTSLSPADVASGDLGKYDVILLGVRTYAARDELRAANNRILEYVNHGGVVMVQYNTPEYDRNYGPYPYTMGRNPEEVTDEASKVNILNPSHPVFNWPNRITEKDFSGWVEERGSKWMRVWDQQYEALLETHDEGQEPQKGGLLYAKYGKGIYIYNAYAFYRQLPDGVPGAYRIFANLLSLAKNPSR